MRQLFRDMESSQLSFWLLIELVLFAAAVVTHHYSLREFYWAGWLLGVPVGVALAPSITAFGDFLHIRKRNRRFQ